MLTWVYQNCIVLFMVSLGILLIQGIIGFVLFEESLFDTDLGFESRSFYIFRMIYIRMMCLTFLFLSIFGIVLVVFLFREVVWLYFIH